MKPETLFISGKLLEVLRLGCFRRRFARTILFLLLVGLAVLSFAAAAHHLVERRGRRVFADVDAIEAREVGVLLGTRRDANGRINLYFQYRIDAAAQLYHAGKIRKILVTGDNGRVSYNEPEDMRRDLIAAGVAPQDIVADYAGFRTLDSILRADKVFGQNRFTVISQPFHCKRAIFLADHSGIDAIGFGAQDVRLRTGLSRNTLRESVARMAAVVDVTLKRGPRYLGPPIDIHNPPDPIQVAAHQNHK